MEPIEILKHLANVCKRNEDGSLTLGTEEVRMIEEAVSEHVPSYAGWSHLDVQDVASNLGYDLPRDLASKIIIDITDKTFEITWETIEDRLLNAEYWGYDLSKFKNEDYIE